MTTRAERHWQNAKARAEAKLAKIAEEKRERKLNAFFEIIRHVSTEMAVRLARELTQDDHKLAFDERFGRWCQSGDVYAVVAKLREELAQAERSYHAR